MRTITDKKTGIIVRLIEDAYCVNNNSYEARAEDDNGNHYIVRWVTVDGWEDHVYNWDTGQCAVDGCLGSCEDESNACDWDSPIEIVPID